MIADVTVRNEVYSLRAALKRATWSYQKDDLASALDECVSILVISPDFAEARHLKGIIHYRCHEYSEAIQSLEAAIAMDPDNASYYVNLGNAHQESSNLEAAIHCYEKAIRLAPNMADAYFNLGNAFYKKSDFKNALQNYDVALCLQPSNSSVLSNRALVLLALGERARALKDLKTATRVDPFDPGVGLNYGVALEQHGNWEQALVEYERVIELDQRLPKVFYNKGKVLAELGRPSEAIDSFDRALTINPGYEKAAVSKGLLLLQLGRFREGFELYEHRWQISEAGVSRRAFSQALWLGQNSIAGKSILLHAEQGLGDTIQFCRYAARVQALGARVILEVQPTLVPLMQTLPGVDQLIAHGDKLPNFDFHCPLMSLPLAFGTTVETIPCEVPYLNADSRLVDRWRSYIGKNGFKIAVAWQGNHKNKLDIGRSFPLEFLRDLAHVEGVRLISIQKGFGSDQLSSLPSGAAVEILPDHFDESEGAFQDTAAIMKCVDLVITSDTSLTHLAGALAIKTWLPLKLSPDWRWMTERPDTPWYPNHRLFRQSSIGDWSSAFRQMESAIRNCYRQTVI